MNSEQLDKEGLRELAKKRLKEKRSTHAPPDLDAFELIENLSIHQEELKIQNEELLRVKAELEASRARYFQLYDLAPVGYITLDRDLIVREANLAASLLLGKDRNRVINRGITTHIAPPCHEILHLHFTRLARGDGEQKHVLAVRREDGNELQVQFESNLIEEGREKGYSRTILTDVTELRRAEEDLKRSNAELQQFAYVASHDLQEPLRMVTVYLGLLNKKFGNELRPQAKDYMNTAVSGAERMRLLIDDLLQYSRIDALKEEKALVNLTVVAEKVKNDLHMAVSEANAQVVIEPLPTVMADGMQMAQVLTNLLSNAIKFRSREPPRIVVFAHHSDHEWIIGVNDNGIGIDPKYHQNLFKMFQRLHTQDEYPGTGIGLAITKKIVERQGGRIWFESELGKGSTFYFSISEKR